MTVDQALLNVLDRGVCAAVRICWIVVRGGLFESGCPGVEDWIKEVLLDLTLKILGESGVRGK